MSRPAEKLPVTTPAITQIRGTDPIIPAVGVHRGVPAEDYHRWLAVSNSWLGRLRKSPAHMLAYLDEGETSAALEFGRAFHCALLEPEIFAVQYARGPEGDRRTKNVRDEWAAMQLEYGPDNVLSPVDYDKCQAMMLALRRKPRTAALLKGEGDTELSLCWNDPTTGLLCKARVDRYSPKIYQGALVDLKTTIDASLADFERSIFTYGYYRQAAHYLTGAHVLGLDARDFVMIAIEKKPPYEARPFRLLDAAIEAGEQELGTLMQRFAECVESNQWPGYPDEVVDVAVPSWAWRQIGENASTEV